MPQHRPMQWQLGGRLGPGAPVPESWSVSPRIVGADRPSCRGVGITAGGPPAPICVRPEFAIGIGRMRLPRRRHRTEPPRTARGTGLCTKGRLWRLGWLVYDPKVPPPASRPAGPGRAGSLFAKTEEYAPRPDMDTNR
jgi:hypothetical protein